MINETSQLHHNEPLARAVIEQRKLEKISQPFQEQLGPIHHTMVGDAGVIVSFDRLLPIAGGNWVMFDLDETVFRFTEAKNQRLESYSDYAAEIGLSLTEAQASAVIELTNKFSRWKESANAGKLYHVDAHMIALSWATTTLRSAQAAGKSFDEAFGEIEACLNRISTGEDADEHDPFRLSHGKLVLHNKETWTHDKGFIRHGGQSHENGKTIDAVFKDSIFKPTVFEEIVEAIKALGSPVDSIHRNNIGFFTKGKLGFQEYKALELMREYPDLPISQFWITEKEKGDFIIEALESGAVTKPELAYYPSELEEDPGDSPSLGSGYPLSMLPHVFVHVDDETAQLASILSKNDYLKTHSQAEFVCVRSIEPGTKTEKQTWTVENSYGALDFTTATLTAESITLTIKANQYLKLREKLGEQHPVVLGLKRELDAKGFELSN